MSCFKKVLLLLSIVGGINWGIYGIWGFNAVGWLLGGSMSWLSRTRCGGSPLPEGAKKAKARTSRFPLFS